MWKEYQTLHNDSKNFPRVTPGESLSYQVLMVAARLVASSCLVTKP